MIEKKCFSKDWIYAKRGEIGGDPTLIEKTIYAFALLGCLGRLGVPMVFKGGTSLMLRLPQIRRLSIDIDILCPLPDSELDKVLTEVARERHFLRYEEDYRGHDRIPARRHFKFSYTPIDTNNLAPHVLLDVVRESPLHPHADAVVIASSLFEVKEEVRVVVPTVENLLGDKLTAFAPDTVGIPCTESLAMQVVKQLFDIESLFDVTQDFNAVFQSYNAIFRAENGYRGGAFSTVQALNDTIETARLICHFNLKGSAQNDRQALLERGRQALTSHLIGGTFSESKAKKAASKAAFLAACLRDDRLQNIKENVPFDFAQTSRLREVVLPDAILQRLRGGNPEAFYYWALAFGRL